MYEDFFEMKKTPFVRSIPVDDLYMDQDTEEIHNRLLYATRRQLFALVIPRFPWSCAVRRESAGVLQHFNVKFRT